MLFALIMGVICLFNVPTLLASQSKKDIEKLLKNFQILSKFEDESEAKKLADSLIKNGQDITIIRQDEGINLKTLSLGLYPDKNEADTVVKHLQKHDIQAYIKAAEDNNYRVYAGAMRDEDHYWERYDKLLGLGYKRIHTELRPTNLAFYFVVRPKNEILPAPIIPPPDISRFVKKNWKHEIFEGRFKGEFSLWGGSENQGSASYFKASASARSTYKNVWDYTYGFRFEAIEQSADNNFQFLDLQWRPVYMRYRQPNNIWTFGAINAVWDDRERDSLSNRLGSRNLTRYQLDSDYTEKEQPTLAFRWELEKADHKLDVMWTPVFRPPKLPRDGAIWHPVNQPKKAIRGIRADDTYEEFIGKGDFDDDGYLTGGIGVRMVRQIGSRIRATTLQYARHAEPYYQLNPDLISQIDAGQTVDQALAGVSGATFTPKHPYTGILTWEEFSKTVQMEIAILTNAPYTTKDYLLKTAMAFEWHLGFVYPKTDKYTHISAFTRGRHINTDDDMLDQKTQIYLTGDLWRDTQNNLWRFSLNYDIALNYFDVFLNPKASFRQAKHIEFYLSYQLFSGSEGTYSGYHTKHSSIILGWQAKF